MSVLSNTRFWEGLGKLVLILPLAAPIAIIPWAAYAQGYVGGGGAAFPLLAPNGTAAAPSIQFQPANLGFYAVSPSIYVSFISSAATLVKLGGGVAVRNGDSFFWSSSPTDASVAGDLFLSRDAANTLAQRNGTNAQTFNLYGTFTDGSNYEVVRLQRSGSAFRLVTDQAGTGTARNLELGAVGNSGINFLVNNSSQFNMTTTNFYPNTNDTHDLGHLASLFWQDFYLTRGTQGSKSKALADAVATQFVRVAIPQTMGSNYAGGQVIYTVYARDATTGTQTLSGIAEFACINNAGTESCAAIVETYKTAAVVTGGTLTCAITAVTGLTDEIALAANCDTSLTSTALNIQYRLDMPQPNTVTPQ